MAHKTQDELAAQLKKAAQQVKIGGFYTHYRAPDQTYRVLYLGFLEASDEPCVIYQALYGEKIIYARAVDRWLDQVEHNGQLVPRFQLASA